MTSSCWVRGQSLHRQNLQYRDEHRDNVIAATVFNFREWKTLTSPSEKKAHFGLLLKKKAAATTSQ
jgi:hypothetical protein